MTSFDVTAGRHHTAARVDQDAWRSSLFDFLVNVTTEQLAELQEYAQTAEDPDAHEWDQDRALTEADLLIRRIYPREQDLPRPAVFIPHDETDVFLAAVADAADRGRLMGVPPFNVTCPECGALPGVRCTWRERNWVPTAAHIKRLQAAAPQRKRGAA